MSLFSTCVVVASNPAQAAEFRRLLDGRIENGLYPKEIDFVVLSDPPGGRVGSGGGTLLALQSILDRMEKAQSVLMIHAGGESRRMPAYAPEGKLFGPVASSSSSVFPPVILDLQLSLYLKYPWNPGELVIASGDVVIDFDAEVLPKDRGEIYGFAKAESFELGSQHGVFKFNRNRSSVVDFFQKQPVEFLEKSAALEGSRSCALDIGIIGFSQRGLRALLSIGETGAPDGETLLDRLKAGRVRFDLYLEVLTACLGGITREDYLQKVRSRSKLDEATLRAIHESFQDISLTGFVAKQARFLHFGLLSEYPESCARLASNDMVPFYVHEEAELRPSLSGRAVILNSRETECRAAENAQPILVEGCDGVSLADARGGNLFLGLTDRRLTYTIPAGVCLDERQVKDGRVTAVYGIDDSWLCEENLDRALYLGVPFRRWLADRRLPAAGCFSAGGPGWRAGGRSV